MEFNHKRLLAVDKEPGAGVPWLGCSCSEIWMWCDVTVLLSNPWHSIRLVAMTDHLCPTRAASVLLLFSQSWSLWPHQYAHQILCLRLMFAQCFGVTFNTRLSLKALSSVFSTFTQNPLTLWVWELRIVLTLTIPPWSLYWHDCVLTISSRSW